MFYDLKHIFPFLIPIVAIIMGVGAGMLAMLLDYRRKREVFELHHKERLAAIERGIEIPPLPAEFFQQTRSPAGLPADYLRRGLIWLLLGLALIAALLMNRGTEAAVWGLLPTAVGLAYLIFYALAAKQPQPGAVRKPAPDA